MGTTRIFVTTDADKADRTAGFWMNREGYGGAYVQKTDSIELTTTDSDTPLWQSEGDGPWYLVVATPDACEGKSNAG